MMSVAVSMISRLRSSLSRSAVSMRWRTTNPASVFAHRLEEGHFTVVANVALVQVQYENTEHHVPIHDRNVVVTVGDRVERPILVPFVHTTGKMRASARGVRSTQKSSDRRPAALSKLRAQPALCREHQHVRLVLYQKHATAPQCRQPIEGEHDVQGGLQLPLQ